MWVLNPWVSIKWYYSRKWNPSITNDKNVKVVSLEKIVVPSIKCYKPLPLKQPHKNSKLKKVTVVTLSSQDFNPFMAILSQVVVSKKFYSSYPYLGCVVNSAEVFQKMIFQILGNNSLLRTPTALETLFSLFFSEKKKRGFISLILASFQVFTIFTLEVSRWPTSSLFC